MCITELRLTCCLNEFTLRENKCRLPLLIDSGPGGCWEKHKHPACAWSIKKKKKKKPTSLWLVVVVVSVPFALGRVGRHCTGCRSAAAADAPLCPCPTLWQLYTWSVEENTWTPAWGKNITWLSGARPQDMSLSHHLNTMRTLYDFQVSMNQTL